MTAQVHRFKMRTSFEAVRVDPEILSCTTQLHTAHLGKMQCRSNFYLFRSVFRSDLGALAPSRSVLSGRPERCRSVLSGRLSELRNLLRNSAAAQRQLSGSSAAQRNALSGLEVVQGSLSGPEVRSADR